MEQPHRLDRGQLNDPENHFSRNRHPSFIVVPGPHRDPQATSQLRPTPFTKQLGSESTEPFRQRVLGLDQVGQRLATGHDSNLFVTVLGQSSIPADVAGIIKVKLKQ